ncbi:protein lin-37 homolog [Orussus abietinus]|uniref:protein lin-37 homolog n=1 Tax=Orussus abietinus TaxID=222816 RepID=UPI000625DECE|nr:protein lin-37 homolog [Orussus abietinus]
MGKKRIIQSAELNRVKVEVKDETGDNDVLVARDRLKGALKELLQHTDSDSSAESSEDGSSQEYKQLKKSAHSPSLEVMHDTNANDDLVDTNGELRDIHSLPLPLPCDEALPRNRIPLSVPPTRDELKLDSEGQTLRSRDSLLKDHIKRWLNVRKTWHRQAHKNEKRFVQSANILSTIFRRAQSEFD